MAEGIGLTEDDREKMRAMVRAGRAASALDGDGEVREEYADGAGGAGPAEPGRPGEAFKVSEELCDYITRAAEANDGNYSATARQFELSRHTVRRHHRGDCAHRGGLLDDRRCAVMREMARDGVSQRDAAERFDVTRGTARHHIVGDCECDSSVPPVSYDLEGSRKVSDEMCRMLGYYHRVEGVPVGELGDRAGLDISRVTEEKHVEGECGCSRGGQARPTEASGPS